VAVVLTLGFGWLIRLLIRPRDRRTAFGFAAAAALVATVIVILFVGPFETARDRRLLHPIEEDYHAALLITQAAGMKDVPPRDLDYLSLQALNAHNGP
jgi:hypothetical protein